MLKADQTTEPSSSNLVSDDQDRSSMLASLHALRHAGDQMVEAFREVTNGCILNIPTTIPLDQLNRQAADFTQTSNALHPYIQSTWSFCTLCKSYAAAVQGGAAIIASATPVSTKYNITYPQFLQMAQQAADGQLYVISANSQTLMRWQSWILAGWYADKHGKYGSDTQIMYGGIGKQIDDLWLTLQQRSNQPYP